MNLTTGWRRELFRTLGTNWLTLHDGLLTAYKVAAEFEFIGLTHRRPRRNRLCAERRTLSGTCFEEGEEESPEAIPALMITKTTEGPEKEL